MSNFQCISTDQANQLLSTSKATIVDVRNANAYEEAHIPNAIHLNDSSIDDFLKNTRQDLPLICYCYHGYSSQRAAAFFIENGFKEVYSVDGGFEEWRQHYGL